MKGHPLMVVVFELRNGGEIVWHGSQKYEASCGDVVVPDGRLKRGIRMQGDLYNNEDTVIVATC